LGLVLISYSRWFVSDHGWKWWLKYILFPVSKLESRYKWRNNSLEIWSVPYSCLFKNTEGIQWCCCNRSGFWCLSLKKQGSGV